MKLFPYHDATCRLVPELDTREVSIDVFCQYLSLSRYTVWERAVRGEYGRTVAEGAWIQKPRQGKRGHWVFRPAVIWRRKAWGRFAVVGFDPLVFEQRVRVYYCNPADTAKRVQEQPAKNADMGDALKHVCGTLLEAMTIVRRCMPAGAEPIAFPGVSLEVLEQ